MTASLVERAGSSPQPYRPRHAPRAHDPAGTFVALTLLLMFVVPGRYAFGPSGVRLDTTNFLGLVALLVWTSCFFFHRRPIRTLNPLVMVLIVYGIGVLFSAGSAYRRPLTEIEANGVLRSSAVVAGALGLGLLLADGLRSVGGVQRVVNLTLFGGYLSSLVGILQKLVDFQYVVYWGRIPGFHTGVDLSDRTVLLDGRSVGTAAHPIEFSVACACLLPFVIVQLQAATTPRARFVHTFGGVLLLAGALVGISRTGIIGLAIVAVLAIPRLGIRRATNVVTAGFLALVVIEASGQNILSRLRYQLLHIGTDNSSQGRTQDYGPVFDLVRKHVWRGIGQGTFNPQEYRYLDNAWLGTLVSGGVIGVIVLALLFFVSLYMGGSVKRSTRSTYLRDITHACCVGLVVLAVAAFFYDEMSFTQTSTLIFVFIGLIGGIWGLRQLGRDA